MCCADSTTTKKIVEMKDRWLPPRSGEIEYEEELKVIFNLGSRPFFCSSEIRGKQLLIDMR